MFASLVLPHPDIPTDSPLTLTLAFLLQSFHIQVCICTAFGRNHPMLRIIKVRKDLCSHLVQLFTYHKLAVCACVTVAGAIGYLSAFESAAEVCSCICYGASEVLRNCSPVSQRAAGSASSQRNF